MKTSEEIDKVSEALALAQGEFKTALKNKQNPHFKNRYADLSSIFDATRPALSKYGLALAQFPDFTEGRVIVVTRLLHKSGQWLEDSFPLKPSADTPQALGSAITYGKRYAAEAILGISGEDEDDGNEASKNDFQTNTTQRVYSQSSSSQNAQLPPVSIQKSEVFDSSNPQMLDRLEKKLIEMGVSNSKHEAIALHLDGKALSKEAFDEALFKINVLGTTFEV